MLPRLKAEESLRTYTAFAHGSGQAKSRETRRWLTELRHLAGLKAASRVASKHDIEEMGGAVVDEPKRA